MRHYLFAAFVLGACAALPTSVVYAKAKPQKDQGEPIIQILENSGLWMTVRVQRPDGVMGCMFSYSYRGRMLMLKQWGNEDYTRFQIVDPSWRNPKYGAVMLLAVGNQKPAEWRVVIHDNTVETIVTGSQDAAMFTALLSNSVLRIAIPDLNDEWNVDLDGFGNLINSFLDCRKANFNDTYGNRPFGRR